MKLKKLLWSILLLTGLVLWTYLLYLNRPNLGGKFGLFPLFAVGWIAITGTTVFILIMEKLRIFHNKDSFFFIFLGVLNVFFGAAGLWQLLTGNPQNGFTILL